MSDHPCQRLEPSSICSAFKHKHISFKAVEAFAPLLGAILPQWIGGIINGVLGADWAKSNCGAPHAHSLPLGNNVTVFQVSLSG